MGKKKKIKKQKKTWKHYIIVKQIYSLVIKDNSLSVISNFGVKPRSSFIG